MLLHSKYSLDFVMKNKISIVNRLLIKAIEEENKEKVWDIWVTLYKEMDKKNFVTFEDFYTKMTANSNNSTTLSADDIIAKAEEIKKRHKTQNATK